MVTEYVTLEPNWEATTEWFARAFREQAFEKNARDPIISFIEQVRYLALKDPEALERMEKVDTLVVDKTGTLTQGKPAVVAVAPASGFPENEVLRLAASVEKASEHPLALAIVAAAQERKIELAPVAEFDSPTGKGVVGVVDGRRLALGNAKFLRELGIATGDLQPDAERLRFDGATAMGRAEGQPPQERT